MTPERQRAIASKGGRAAHQKGTAHEFTKEEARAAGKKGENAVVDRLGWEHLQAIGRRGGRSVSVDREHMAEIGRRGGQAVSASAEHMAEIGRIGGRAKKTLPVETPVPAQRLAEAGPASEAALEARATAVPTAAPLERVGLMGLHLPLRPPPSARPKAVV